ncbi:MAG: DUF1492 domain-containing protein [Muribaculaceae bacterium]|nr:DUF1492 domain-containing protein [Muribaculaceae bacterium]
MQFRQILRTLGKTPKGKVKLREILYKNRHRMTAREFNILEFTYINQLSTLDVSDKIGLATTQYHNVLNTALAKLEVLIDNITLREIVEIL